MSRRNLTALAFSAVFIALGAAAFAANGAGWDINLVNPARNNTFAPNAPIGVYKGTASWQPGNDSIDDVAMYTLTVNSNPNLGIQVSSNYANYTKAPPNPNGGGSGTFNSKNVSPPLLAPSTFSTGFWVVAVPQNAASGEFPNPGDPRRFAQPEKTQPL